MDEGVFGDTIGKEGVVAFDSSGIPIFKYHEFIEKNDLPFVSDCYAMNVSGDDEVWICYYTDFPLVCLKGFQLKNIWKDFGCMDRAFAIFGETVVLKKCYTRREGRSRLIRRHLSGSLDTEEELTPIDDSGGVITGHFGAAARGPNFYLWTDNALLKLL